MDNGRRDFVKWSLSGLGLAGLGTGDPVSKQNHSFMSFIDYPSIAADELNMIGPIGPWAVSKLEKELPRLSFRRNEFASLAKWKKMAAQRLLERLAVPDLGPSPRAEHMRQFTYDGLHVEELRWQLPYGRATEALLIKPADARGKLPAILGFHDHGGNKYFGTRKITRTSDDQHPLMREHQDHYYEGTAWANDIARRGYVVLVSDAFPFASRRVLLSDVPERLREGLTDNDPEDPASVKAYNEWASQHEHIMAKSLFSAGTTWPGTFFAEDRVALDILSAREDVDASNIGCCGLSGGGMRTAFMGGLDPRIKCAVDVGFMTTWKDFALNKSYTHTWMVYVPVLPNELDFPEILGLRAPLPTMVLNDEHDQLYTLPEMKVADNILSRIFEKAGASDRYKCSFYPGPHKFDKAMQKEAFDWFDRWLK